MSKTQAFTCSLFFIIIIDRTVARDTTFKQTMAMEKTHRQMSKNLHKVRSEPSAIKKMKAS